MADTREQILEAAWDLFSERGFEAVSIRDVTNAAGVNLASVSYHFGGKEGLIQETVKRCLTPMYQHAIRLLDAAAVEYGSEEAIPLKVLIGCRIRPLMMPEECGVRVELLLRLIARYLIEHDYAVPVVSKQVLLELYRRYIKALSYHLPDWSEDQIMKGLMFVQGAALYSAGVGQIVTKIIRGEEVNFADIDRNALLKEVMTFAMKGFAGKPL